MATIGNTIGSLIGYAIGAWGGRPFLERYGKYLLIRPHEIELAEHFFQATARRRRSSAACCRSSGRSSASRPGVARMPLGTFIVYSTAGAFLWSTLLVFAGVQLGANWVDIRHALQPFDLLIAVAVVAGVVALRLVAARDARPARAADRASDRGRGWPLPLRRGRLAGAGAGP